MKNNVLCMILAVFCLLFKNCVSFKIQPLLPIENQVEYIYLCQGIDESTDLLKPVKIQSEFDSKNVSIFCLIRLKDISNKMQIRWKWYEPDKEMMRDSGSVIVNEDEKYLEIVTAYDKLNLDTEKRESIKGQWVVVIFIDGKLIGERLFQVN